MKAPEDIRQWMELAVDELPPPVDLVPGAVRVGKRRRLHRRLTVAGGSLSVLALAAGLFSTLPGGVADDSERVARQSGPASVASMPLSAENNVPSGSDASPDAKPSDPKSVFPPRPWAGTPENEAAIFTALQAALPAALPGEAAKIERDPGSLGSYILTRADGRTSGLYAVFREKHSMHSQVWEGCLPTPVGKPLPVTDCRRQTLGDGTEYVLGKLDVQPRRSVQLLLPLSWGPLVGFDSSNQTAYGKTTTGDPLAYEQLTALISNPQVLQALRS